MQKNMSSKFLNYVVLFVLVAGATGLVFEYGQTVSAQKRSSLDEKNDQQSQFVKMTKADARSEAPAAVVSGTLALADPTFNRPVSCAALSGVGTAVHYDAIPFTVTSAGAVTLSLETADGGSITPNAGGVGPDTFMVLYTGTFNSASPLTNCNLLNDDISGATNRRSRISGSLPAGSYTVVLTSFANTPVAAADDDPLPWTYTLAINGPTASGVSVGGRVITPEGRGLRGARVTMTNLNGTSRTTITGTFGRFQFEDVEPGQTYIVSIGSRRYSYTPQTVQVNDNIADLDFVAGQ